MLKKGLINIKNNGILFVIAALLLISPLNQSKSTLSTGMTVTLFKIMLYVIALIYFVVLVLPVLKEKKLEGFNIFSLLAILNLYMISIINVYESSNSSLGIIHLIFWVLFCLAPLGVKEKSFVQFKKVWTIICAFGIVFFISYIFGLFIPYKEVQYYGTFVSRLEYAKYIDYGFIYLYKNPTIIRLCGICNEPGFHGTLCALILCASKFDLKNKSNLIIFLSGIFTFSVAFVLIIAFYLLLRSWKNWRIFLLILIISIGYIFILPNLHFKSRALNHFVNRFTITENNKLSGDDRTDEELDSQFNYVMSEHPIFGMGNGYINAGYSSYKPFIIQYGIVGCLLVWGVLLLSTIRYMKKDVDVLFFVIVFFLSIYQRANIMILPYEIILYGGIIHLSLHEKKELQSKNENYGNESRG